MHESLRLRFLEAGQSIATCNCIAIVLQLYAVQVEIEYPERLSSIMLCCKFHVV